MQANRQIEATGNLIKGDRIPRSENFNQSFLQCTGSVKVEISNKLKTPKLTSFYHISCNKSQHYPGEEEQGWSFNYELIKNIK